MDIGILLTFRNAPKWQRPFPQFYREQIAHAEFAEDLGYDTVWISEHHFAEDGYIPSPLQAASAIAMTTERVRIATNLMVLPLHNAVRVAEDAATADIISNGRFELGVGRGYARHEFDGYGISRKELGSRLREGLEVIQGLWSNECFSYEGKHYNLKNARLTPRPVQKPYPPIWVGTHGPQTIDIMAANGYHFLGAGLLEVQQAYDAALIRHGRPLASGKSCHLSWTHVAETEDQAWANVQHQLHYQSAMYTKWNMEAGDMPEHQRPEAMPSVEELRYKMGDELGVLAIGTPDQVAEKLLNFTKKTRTTHLCLGMNISGLPPELSRRSMELFAREVMPHLR